MVAAESTATKAVEALLRPPPRASALTDQLDARLSAYGLDARAARTNLMLDLAAEGLAPSFLADLLGWHPGTAERWVHAVGGDWTGYVAARSR